MKYIRTKDSIDLLIKSIDSYIVKDSESSFEKAIDEETLLKNYKVADTIEELVDGYYLDIDNHHFDSTQVYDKDELQRALYEKMDWQSYSDRKYLGYEINLYAFIKIDKGFIFVAKMNEGELELL